MYPLSSGLNALCLMQFTPCCRLQNCCRTVAVLFNRPLSGRGRLGTHSGSGRAAARAPPATLPVCSDPSLHRTAPFASANLYMTMAQSPFCR